jgi:hypothetical protein
VPAGSVRIVPTNDQPPAPPAELTSMMNDGLPTEFALGQNYPNPFNPNTNIKYQIPSTNQVTLRVFDLLGREVATLVNDVKEPGAYTVRLDATGFASGVYFYRLKAGDFVQTKRMLLMR